MKLHIGSPKAGRKRRFIIYGLFLGIFALTAIFIGFPTPEYEEKKTTMKDLEREFLLTVPARK